jgi:isopenicillin N synthase-like dioxygenase
MAIPVIDVGGEPSAIAAQVDEACRTHGFFTIVEHGIDPARLDRLVALAHEFFALPEAEKGRIAMRHGGKAWRGWFGVGDELTDGVPDRKEGLYFGEERSADDPRPLHGPNLFPDVPPGLRAAVLDHVSAMTALGARLVRLMGVPDELVADPVVLFRIFHYPPAVGEVDEGWGVAEHTDYGLLTMLAQDQSGGLQVKGPDGWVDVPPVPGALVCNIGDMLQSLTNGAYRSTAHRVRSPAGGSGTGRISAPFFFDPSWDARVPGVDGTYGDYLLAKVANVFPDLRDAVL